MECRDQGGCDEFWAEVWASKRRREAPRSYTATQKQIGFMRSMVAKKQLTDEAIIAKHANVERILSEGRGVNGFSVSAIIDHAKTCADKIATPEVTAPIANVEPASVKQIGFMNVLLKKKDVSPELLAQVDEAKASKAKASKLIDALTKCADKVLTNV
jgi:hypothetical protein